MDIDRAAAVTTSPAGRHMIAQTLRDLDARDRQLVEDAKKTSARAYAPYSRFAVGAAVRTRSGNIFCGANLENSAYGASTCAEIAALANANTAGDFDVEAIAIVGYNLDPVRDDRHVVTPCGRCRQVIFEAAVVSGVDVRVLSASGNLDQISVSTIFRLLPAGFGPANLGRRER
jgi:cytidine deaminase